MVKPGAQATKTTLVAVPITSGVLLANLEKSGLPLIFRKIRYETEDGELYGDFQTKSVVLEGSEWNLHPYTNENIVCTLR